MAVHMLQLYACSKHTYLHCAALARQQYCRPQSATEEPADTSYLKVRMPYLLLLLLLLLCAE